MNVTKTSSVKALLRGQNASKVIERGGVGILHWCARHWNARTARVARFAGELDPNLGVELKRTSGLAVASLLLSLSVFLPNACLAGTDDAAAAAAVTIAASTASAAPAETGSSSAASSAASEPAAPQPAAPSHSTSDEHRSYPAGFCCGLIVGAGVDASTLGIGVQVAAEVLPRANVRVGFNFFNYAGSLTSDGISYTGNLNLRSANANFDYFLVRSFHVSPGLLVYDGNHAADGASVPGGKSFILGSTTYESSAFSPIAANASLRLTKVAPELLFGMGNLVSRARARRRWSIEVEAGVAYQGTPKVALELTGFACNPPSSAGPSCVNAATDPSVQSNIQLQAAKLSRQAAIFKFYPVISIGIGFSF